MNSDHVFLDEQPYPGALEPSPHPGSARKALAHFVEQDATKIAEILDACTGSGSSGARALAHHLRSENLDIDAARNVAARVHDDLINLPHPLEVMVPAALKTVPARDLDAVMRFHAAGLTTTVRLLNALATSQL